MAKYNTYMNELPENESSHPWTKVSDSGTYGIETGKVRFEGESYAVYKREDGQGPNDNVDVVVSMKWTSGYGADQYIHIDDGNKLIEINILTSGKIQINGSTSTTNLTADQYNTIRVKKTAQSTVELYVDNTVTPTDSFSYGSLPSASTGNARVEFRFGADIYQESMLNYVNYAIGEDADIIADTRINTLMGVLPHNDPTDPWTLGSDVGTKAVSNGIFTVIKDGTANVGYSRTGDTYATTDEIDFVVKLKLEATDCSFVAKVCDGVKKVDLTVETTSVGVFQYYLNSETPTTMTYDGGWHVFRIVKTGETSVKVYADNASSPTYSSAYAALPAYGTKKIEFISAISGSNPDSKISVDYLNYGIGVDAYEPEEEGAYVKLMRIQDSAGHTREHNPATDAIEFDVIKSQKFRSDGNMSIKAADGSIEIIAGSDLSMAGHVTEYLPPVGNPSAVIGGDYAVGSQSSANNLIKLSSTDDNVFTLPNIDGTQANSILHALSLISTQVNTGVKKFTAGETIAPGRCVRFSAEDTVVTANCTSILDAHVVGITVLGGAVGTEVEVVLPGKVVTDVLSGATTNASYFLNSVGGLAATVPTTSGYVIAQIGYANGPNDLFIELGDLKVIA
jgi:hypothetical protein